MKDKPWIEESDPLKNSYGLLTQSELNAFLEMFDLWNSNLRSSHVDLIQQDIKDIKSGVKLLDFSDNYNEYCQHKLFEEICVNFKGDDNILYWIPLTDENEQLFKDFSPFMIAKTNIDVHSMNLVRRSFMQMLNGAYMLFDGKRRFVGIIMDGYYMMLFLNKKYMQDEFLPYIENWNHLDENLDEVVKNDLIYRSGIVG